VTDWERLGEPARAVNPASTHPARPPPLKQGWIKKFCRTAYYLPTTILSLFFSILFPPAFLYLTPLRLTYQPTAFLLACGKFESYLRTSIPIGRFRTINFAARESSLRTSRNDPGGVGCGGNGKARVIGGGRTCRSVGCLSCPHRHRNHGSSPNDQLHQIEVAKGRNPAQLSRAVARTESHQSHLRAVLAACNRDKPCGAPPRVFCCS
jgi:hypothetical protein